MACVPVRRRILQTFCKARSSRRCCATAPICPLLNQSDIELELLHRTLGISDTLLEYVHNVPPGCGLLKFGDKYIPKDNRLDKESKLYQLFNTNFHEKVEEKRR